MIMAQLPLVGHELDGTVTPDRYMTKEHSCLVPHFDRVRTGELEHVWIRVETLVLREACPSANQSTVPCRDSWAGVRCLELDCGLCCIAGASRDEGQKAKLYHSYLMHRM